MAQINFTIPQDKVQRVIDAIKGLFPIPLDENDNPLFTEAEWSKECVRRWIVRQVARYETMVAKEAAVVPEEDDIIT